MVESCSAEQHMVCLCLVSFLFSLHHETEVRQQKIEFVLFNSLGKTQRKKRITIKFFSLFLQKYDLETLVFFLFFVLAVPVQSLGPAALGFVETQNIIPKITYSQDIISEVTAQYNL